MNLQKFINTYIFLGVILSVCLAKFFWGWIDIGYVKEFEIPGEYSKFKYNPINETIRYVTFISLPLIVYLICIKIFRGKEIKEIKEIFFYNNIDKKNIRFMYKVDKIESIKNKSSAVFVSNDLMPTNADEEMPFIQNTNLFYLTGIDQEDTFLILAPDFPDKNLREILFIKETSEEISIKIE